MKNTNEIRVPLLLYAETSGIKKKQTVIKRIVEAVFLHEDNRTLDYKEISEVALDVFELYISEYEVMDVIENKKGNRIFMRVSDGNNVKYQLTQKRLERLQLNAGKNLEEIILEFIQRNEYSIENKEIIYTYLYRLFQKNLEEFKNIIGGEMSIDESQAFDLTPEENEMIKKFIEWEDDEKNEVITALLGSSLEYAMLTCDGKGFYGTRLGNIFSNKTLYLDTNIIYYCLGINGKDYQECNRLLLNKCLNAKEKLKITAITEKEFYNTLNHFINEIKKYDSKSIGQINFDRYRTRKDIYLFYLEWKKEHRHFSEVAYFKQYILDEYKRWLEKYKVEVDNDYPYNDEDENVVKELNYLSQQISFRGNFNYDTTNIYWIDCLRNTTNTRVKDNFTEQKYFLLSPHKKLQKWENSRGLGLPVVISPEIWMILLSRFVSRTENEYNSFVRFINIKSTEEEKINNKEFFIIVKAVEEITVEIEEQESIIDVMVAENFEFLQKEDDKIPEDEIFIKAKEKAEHILSDKIKILENKVNSINEIMDAREVEHSEKLKQVQSEIEEEREHILVRYRTRIILIKRVIHGVLIAGMLSFLCWQFIDFL